LTALDGRKSRLEHRQPRLEIFPELIDFRPKRLRGVLRGRRGLRLRRRASGAHCRQDEHE
jgi:hypothetical protein